METPETQGKRTVIYDTGFLVRLFVCRESEVGRTKFDPYVIGNNIRDLREKRKMTQMKAAEKMDMSLWH